MLCNKKQWSKLKDPLTSFQLYLMVFFLNAIFQWCEHKQQNWIYLHYIDVEAEN